ncbi:MAG: cyclopropane fatty acyl phospholipid synthase [Dehalococcoidia bacterium SG8_51_3]|uniref:Cyclopropane fatty acyl phospholipid synthase n=1 Tax=candidate division WOR_3 bacterium SM23_42 TaxID=1703779 RepID=A0A0S8FWD8_UNCW3|nr:MAG: cyclopropane fatty acyl phospholipid synthase [Dehalococcoidia bacterium SG8_51_3]KPK64426.1 MAG: cyclopropane fatty acyl phospholipid synthase [candidate division WOR_3 bacterium SM23_42]
MDRLKETAEELLCLAGVEINGNHPWDIKVHNDDFYHRVLTQGSLGLGESYMDTWWDCEELDQFVYRIVRANLEDKVRGNWKLLLRVLAARIFNLQSKSKAFVIGERHYDLGNELFENMLDKRMVYSCAYWKNANTLDEAQENKLDLICRKIGLQPGMRILDIGCGWGSLAKYAAEKYDAKVVGITVSKEQVTLGRDLCKGLPVEIRLQDYRDISESFDHVVSVGMFEHVGYKNYKTFMRCVRKCLKDDGLFLLHTIGGNESVIAPEPWTHKYIFPNGLLPSIRQIGAAIEGLFVMEDWHNFSVDYDRTLMAWHRNFEKSWDAIKSNYDERFYRMWRYFLLSNAGAFRARKNQLWQLVLSKKGVEGGYAPIR